MAFPLINRQPDATIAWLTQDLNGLSISEQEHAIDSTLAISATQFLQHVARLSNSLPAHRHAINVCDNRYLFMVSLCAVIQRGGVNLLPPNKNVATQAQLVNDYDNCVVIHDGQCEVSDVADAIDLSTLDWSLDDSPTRPPQIDEDHLAVISFTSGSTGRSKPNLKYWRTLVQSSAINAGYMLIEPQRCHAHIATVPGQHMWGFETSVLLPMFSEAALVDARPFFPADIMSLIARLPTPSTLISAPVHLRSLSATLCDANSDDTRTPLQNLKSILCATAPLSSELAHQLEQQTNARLQEVYGCSEVGSMAIRRTALETVWTSFDGLRFEQVEDDDTALTQTHVEADHLPGPVILQDQLSFTGKGFELIGRSSDQINIAGKRGSLTEVNHVLSQFKDLVDGVVIFPEQDRVVPRLAAMVVLKNQEDKQALRTHMATYLDSAFVPRPILVVDALPREENGKLSQAKVMRFYSDLTTKA